MEEDVVLGFSNAGAEQIVAEVAMAFGGPFFAAAITKVVGV